MLISSMLLFLKFVMISKGGFILEPPRPSALGRIDTLMVLAVLPKITRLSWSAGQMTLTSHLGC